MFIYKFLKSSFSNLIFKLNNYGHHKRDFTHIDDVTNIIKGLILKKINKNNVNKLDLAWKYKIKGDVFNDIQSNVIVAEKKIYIPSYNKKIITLDAKTGSLIWKLHTILLQRI